MTPDGGLPCDVFVKNSRQYAALGNTAVQCTCKVLAKGQPTRIPNGQGKGNSWLCVSNCYISLVSGNLLVNWAYKTIFWIAIPYGRSGLCEFAGYCFFCLLDLFIILFVTDMKEVKRRRLSARDETFGGVELMPRSLCAIGEAFMSSFDDYTETPWKEVVAAPSLKATSRMPDETDDASFTSSGDEGKSFGRDSGKGEGAEGVECGQEGPAPEEVVFKMQRRDTIPGRQAHRKGVPGAGSAKTYAKGGGPLKLRLQQNLGDVVDFDLETARREVADFGAAGLDKANRKAFETRRLKALNLRPDKGQRIPKGLGKQMAKCRADRERKEQEQAVAAGMLQVKGSGKRKRRAVGKGRLDRGLMEDGGAYRNGVLRLKGGPSKKVPRVPSIKKIRL
eukprot:jgi/Botrbrau1/16082/Bobra.7_2s0053.1